jgi:hypothetical protein
VRSDALAASKTFEACVSPPHFLSVRQGEATAHHLTHGTWGSNRRSGGDAALIHAVGLSGTGMVAR